MSERGGIVSVVDLIRSLMPGVLLGSLAGARSMTPLAGVSVAAALSALPPANGAPKALRRPAVMAGTIALAGAELWGDKLESAPDRIVPAGLAARAVTGAVVGMALASKSQRGLAAAAGATAAIAAAFPTFAGRMRSMRSHGQTSTGLAEDAVVILGTLAILGWASRRGHAS